MYYFKDHLNFSNNLQDNLYILRQRQLKEATYSPSSGGPAVPDSAAGTNELKDRMRNIKQSGDRKQSKEYLEMETEVNRREGTGSSGIPQSSDVKTDRVAGDWVERYARKLDMDPRKVENIRRGVIDMDTSGRGEDPISQTQDQVAQRGVEAYDKAKQYVVDMQKRDADKKAKSTSPGVATTKPQSIGLDLGDTSPGKPYAVPGSQDWNNMSHEEQQEMVTRALKNKEVHKFTGGRDAVDPNAPNGERMRFNTDNGSDSFAADTNQRSKLANDVIDRSRQNANREIMDLWNRPELADDSMSPGRPWFWPKTSNTSETPKPAEDTRPTSGRTTLYPGSNSTSQEPSLQDMLNTMIDRMKNNSNLPRPTFRPRVGRRPRSK